MRITFDLICNTEEEARNKHAALQAVMEQNSVPIHGRYYLPIMNTRHCVWADGTEQYRISYEIDKPTHITKEQACRLVNSVQVCRFSFPRGPA